jgi:L-arabinose isomerase
MASEAPSVDAGAGVEVVWMHVGSSHDSRQAEVAQLQRAIFRLTTTKNHNDDYDDDDDDDDETKYFVNKTPHQQDVGWLDVSVNDVSAVNVTDSE